MYEQQFYVHVGTHICYEYEYMYECRLDLLLCWLRIALSKLVGYSIYTRYVLCAAVRQRLRSTPTDRCSSVRTH